MKNSNIKKAATIAICFAVVCSLVTATIYAVKFIKPADELGYEEEVAYKENIDETKTLEIADSATAIKDFVSNSAVKDTAAQKNEVKDTEAQKVEDFKVTNANITIGFNEKYFKNVKVSDIVSVADENATAKDGQQLTLNYVESKKVTNTNTNLVYERDRYLDENGREYRFDSSTGKLVSYRYSGDPSVPDLPLCSKEDMLSEQQLIKLATEHLVQFYGDQIEGYKLIYFSPGSSNGPVLENYHAEYALTYGTDDVIHVGLAYICIHPDGLIYSSLLKDPSRYADFDPELVKDIGREEIAKFIEKEVKNDYPDKDLIGSIILVNLTSVDNEFALNIRVELKEPGATRTFDAKTYIYPLS